jgi:hypothetical protein
VGHHQLYCLRRRRLSYNCPIIPILLNFFFSSIAPSSTVLMPFPEYYLYIALVLSGAIAVAIVYSFREMALDKAEKLLADAERL